MWVFAWHRVRRIMKEVLATYSRVYNILFRPRDTTRCLEHRGVDNIEQFTSNNRFAVMFPWQQGDLAKVFLYGGKTCCPWSLPEMPNTFSCAGLETEYDPLEPNRRAVKARVGRLRDPCNRVLSKRAQENSLLSEKGAIL